MKLGTDTFVLDALVPLRTESGELLGDLLFRQPIALRKSHPDAAIVDVVPIVCIDGRQYSFKAKFPVSFGRRAAKKGTPVVAKCLGVVIRGNVTEESEIKFNDGDDDPCRTASQRKVAYPKFLALTVVERREVLNV